MPLRAASSTASSAASISASSARAGISDAVSITRRASAESFAARASTASRTVGGTPSVSVASTSVT